MALPIFAPRLQPQPLPSDVMSRIGGAQQNIAKGRLAMPILQSLLKQRQAATEASEAQTALEPATAALRRAQTAALPSEVRLREAQAFKAFQPKQTPAQLATNEYLEAFHADPKSPRTKFLGAALKKAVSVSKGASITTSDGTQISFGGTAAPTITPGAEGVNQKDANAFQALFPAAPPPKVSILPGQSRSRKFAGATIVDSDTGAITSTATRATTTLNQQAVESVQKALPQLTDIVRNVGNYVGLKGFGNRIEDMTESALFSNEDAAKRISNYRQSDTEFNFVASDLIKAMGQRPTEYETKVMSQTLRPTAFETEKSYKERILKAVPKLLIAFARPAQEAQIRGVKVGHREPETGALQVTPVAPVAPQGETPGTLGTIATNDLINIASGK